MNLSKRTILVTGGSSGIGLELAKVLSNRGNKVLICGRSQEKLEKAKKLILNLEAFQCDLSSYDDCSRLANWVKNQHPNCSVLINNAALVHTTDLYKDDQAIVKANLEFQTNTLAPITLTKLLMPVLQESSDGILINVTTGLVYAPKAAYPFYCATKAALHSFTQGLRFRMKGSRIKIIEVMFPAVDTPWHRGHTPRIAISPEEAVQEMIVGLEKGKEEIYVGKVKLFRLMSRIAPGFALRKINTLK